MDPTENASPSPPTERRRTAFTPWQLIRLVQGYSKSCYMSRERRIIVGNELNLPEETITTWFQNRRMKEKNLRLQNAHPPAKVYLDPARNMQTNSYRMSPYGCHGNNNMAPMMSYPIQLSNSLPFIQQPESVLIDNRIYSSYNYYYRYSPYSIRQMTTSVSQHTHFKKSHFEPRPNACELEINKTKLFQPYVQKDCSSPANSDNSTSSENVPQ